MLLRGRIQRCGRPRRSDLEALQLLPMVEPNACAPTRPKHAHGVQQSRAKSAAFHTLDSSRSSGSKGMLLHSQHWSSTPVIFNPPWWYARC